MRVLTTLPQADLRKTAEAARAAEAAGYDGLLTMENKHDSFLAHAIAAVNTGRIELGTSVAIAFPRSPMVVANACWDLQNASRGRFVLGIGPQIKPHNERRFSVPWTAPAPRLREYVQALRAIWRNWQTGEKLDFRGQHYTFTLMPPYFMPPSMGQKMVPVTLAARWGRIACGSPARWRTASGFTGSAPVVTWKKKSSPACLKAWLGRTGIART